MLSRRIESKMPPRAVKKTTRPGTKRRARGRPKAAQPQLKVVDEPVKAEEVIEEVKIETVSTEVEEVVEGKNLEDDQDDDKVEEKLVDTGLDPEKIDRQSGGEEGNQIAVVNEEEKDIVDFRKKGIAGVESEFGTKVVNAEFVPLYAGEGETWRGFHVGKENAELLRGLQKSVPDFFSNVYCASSKRVVQSLSLLASNLAFFEDGQLKQVEAGMLRMMKDEFKDLERDGFLVDWAFEEIDRALKFPIEQEMNHLAEMERGLEKEVAKLHIAISGFKEEIEDCKFRIAVCNQQLVFAEDRLQEKEVELNRLRSELELWSRMLLDA